MRLYHGTDLDSASRLLAGEPLDAVRAAALKIDGPAGFFLSVAQIAAEFFAVRRSRKPGAVIAYDCSDGAIAQLQAHGAIRRPIPHGQRSPRFLGDEFYVPPGAFDAFNALAGSGEVSVAAAP